MDSKNSEGRMYGVTFVDNVTKSIFKGSDLGKFYSVAALQSRLTFKEAENQQAINHPHGSQAFASDIRHKKREQPALNTLPLLMKELTSGFPSSKTINDAIPSELLKKEKRRKQNPGR